MNVAYVIDEFPPVLWGGLGTYAAAMTKELVKRGIHPTVLSRNDPACPVSDLWNGIVVYRPSPVDVSEIISFLVPPEVRTWALADQEYYLQMMLSYHLGAHHLIRTLDQGKNRNFRLAIAHEWTGAAAGLILQESLDIPLIFHVHSHEQGRMKNPSQVVLEIEKTAAERADAIITVSYAMKDALVKTGYPAEKIRVVYNGVDPETYNPDLIEEGTIAAFRESLGIFENPMVLCIGRLTWTKGMDELIRAMPAVIREIPDTRLVIVGVGEMEGHIRAMIEEQGLSGAVLMDCRHVTEQERLLYYAACDCAVFPSKYEPFGIVCTEAMAMAKPVVVGATGISGLSEQVAIVGSDQCGYHINPWNPADIAKYLLILLKNPETRIRFGLAGRYRVRTKFTWNIAAEETASVYREVMDAKRSNIA